MSGNDYIKKLKSENPEKYQEYLKKKREYNKRYRDKIKQDPVKYKEYRDKHNKYQREWIKKHKDLNDEKYKRYIDTILKYNKSHSDKINEANKRSRQKRGKEYIKNYMREYRKNKSLKPVCEECEKILDYETLNGLCYDCFLKQESQGTITCIYPKVYWVNDTDIIATKWNKIQTLRWYNLIYDSTTVISDMKEIINIDTEGYWDIHLLESDKQLLDMLNNTGYFYISKQPKNTSFGDLQVMYGDYYKFISFKEGLLKYYMNIQEPQVLASREF